VASLGAIDGVVFVDFLLFRKSNKKNTFLLYQKRMYFHNQSIYENYTIYGEY